MYFYVPKYFDIVNMAINTFSTPSATTKAIENDWLLETSRERQPHPFTQLHKQIHKAEKDRDR